MEIETSKKYNIQSESILSSYLYVHRSNSNIDIKFVTIVKKKENFCCVLSFSDINLTYSEGIHKRVEI